MTSKKCKPKRRGRGIWDDIKSAGRKVLEWKQIAKDFIIDNKLVSKGAVMTGNPGIGLIAGLAGYGKRKSRRHSRL